MKFVKYLAAVLVMMIATVSEAQFSSTSGAFPGLPTRITAGAISNVNSIIALPAGNGGFSMGAIVVATNISASNVTFRLSYSLDGVTFTPEVRSLIHVLNNTTNTPSFTNWTKDDFGSPTHVRLDSITNQHSSTVFLTNVFFNVR